MRRTAPPVQGQEQPQGRGVVNVAMLASGALLAAGVTSAARCEAETCRDRRARWLMAASSCALLAAYVALVARRAA